MRPSHRWIILYDISNPKKLRKIAKIMESFAFRVQHSVFEAYGNIKTIEELRSRIKDILGEEDTVAYIPLCVNDWENTTRLGISTRHREDPCDDKTLFL